MKKKTCVIYDEDEKFIGKFMEVISRKSKMLFRIMAFTRKEALVEYISENGTDLLVLGEQYFCKEIESIGSGKVILLCEEDPNRSDEAIDMRIKKIFRYQSSENLLREMISFLSEGIEQESGAAIITGVYSPVNASSKTSLALAIACAYAESATVLYINLEEFSGLGDILENGNNGDLSDVIYYYRTMPQNFTKQIENIVGHKDKISYIPPLKCAQDMYCMTSEEMADMIFCIGKNCGYERIVLDISNAVKEPWKLIEICNRTLVPIREDYISKKKINDFETYLLSLGDTEIYDRMEKILVPIDNEGMLTTEFIKKVEWSSIGRFARELAYG